MKMSGRQEPNRRSGLGLKCHRVGSCRASSVDRMNRLKTYVGGVTLAQFTILMHLIKWSKSKRKGKKMKKDKQERRRRSRRNQAVMELISHP